jgi:transglutaminase-like putative cysteine protease
MRADPFIPTVPYRDGFGNWCTRILAPAGRLRLSARALLRDSGEPDPIAVAGHQHPVEELPEDVVVYLLGSRYCETDRLTEAAWDLFGRAPSGAARVQAICDYVHRHITFNYQDARATRTAWDAMQERKGVCRDYAHLAVALCRCMNIPARYCTGYLTDIGVEPPLWPDGLRGLVRGLHRRALAHLRRPQQHAAHRPRADGARPRCHRRGHQQHVRPQHADGLYGLG